MRIPKLHPSESIDMVAAIPFLNTFLPGSDGKLRRVRHYVLNGKSFRVMGRPSVDSVKFRLADRPTFRKATMIKLGFSPKIDKKTGFRTGWYKNFALEPYVSSSEGFANAVSFDWYHKWGTYLDIFVKSMTRYHFHTSMKSFPDYRSYLYPLAMLQLLYKESTTLKGDDYGFDAFQATIARLDIALNLQFYNKADALAFIAECSRLKIPHMKFTLPEDLPNAAENGVVNGTGIYFVNKEQWLVIYLKDAVDPKARNVVRIEMRMLSSERLTQKVKLLNKNHALALNPVAEDLFRPNVLHILSWEKFQYLLKDAVPAKPPTRRR